MKTDDIKKIALAMEAVKGNKLDPVGKHDKDIDNDGDHDGTDKYLIKRRKTVTKAIGKDKANTEVQVQESEELDEIASGSGNKVGNKLALANKGRIRFHGPTGWHHVYDKDGKKVNTGIKIMTYGQASKWVKDNMKEEVEGLDELSKKTLGNYINKSVVSVQNTQDDIAHSGIKSPEYSKLSKKRSKRKSGIRTAVNKLSGSYMTKVHASESVEELDELSKKTLGSYVKKAKDDFGMANRFKGRSNMQDKDAVKSSNKRSQGIDRAVDRLTKEEVEGLDELSKKTLGSYIKAAAADRGTYGIQAGSSARHSKDEKEALRGMRNRYRGISKATDRLTKEEVEELDELSIEKMKAYHVAAKANVNNLMPDLKDRSPENRKNTRAALNSFKKRNTGMDLAKYKIGKKVVGEEVEDLEELSKKTLGSYIKKATDSVRSKSLQTGHNRGLEIHGNGSDTEKRIHNKLASAASKVVKKRETGITRAVNRLTREEVEEIDELSKNTLGSYAKKAGGTGLNSAGAHMANFGIHGNKASLKKGISRAKGVVKAIDRLTKEDLDEGYKENEKRWMDQLTAVTGEIADMAEKLYADHYEACKAMERIQAAYAKGETPSEEDRKMSNNKVYDIKYLIRQLEDVRDSLEMKAPSSDLPPAVAKSNVVGRYYEAVSPTKETPISIRQALAMMEDRALQTAGATEPEPIDDKLSGKEKGWINVHAMEVPDETNIDAATAKNKTEVQASLQRAVNYRHNDQKIGDK